MKNRQKYRQQGVRAEYSREFEISESNLDISFMKIAFDILEFVLKTDYNPKTSDFDTIG